MARTKKVRPSQGISNILSQRRQGNGHEEESEEDERDYFIEHFDQPRQRSRPSTSEGDGGFKRPHAKNNQTSSSKGRTPHRVSTCNLDLSVKKYAQQKLPILKEVCQIDKSKIEETSIHFITEENGVLSHYMKLSYAAAMSSKHIDQSTIYKTSALDLMKKLSERQPVVGTYVLEFFEGELFNLLEENCQRESKCRIFGPDVMIQAKHVDHIPKSGKPLLSLSMLGLTVCSSSYSRREKDEFASKVYAMGGVFSKSLLKTTSVLIAEDVVSQKSQLARKHHIPIVSHLWLDKCWSSAHRQSIIRAVDKIDEFRLPIFAGVRISVSQVTPDVRVRLEKGAKKYGYVYQPDLSERVTHLICLREEGAKFDFSRERDIYTIKYDWVVKSVQAGYALPEVDFMVGGPLDKDDEDPLEIKSRKKTTTIERVVEDSQSSLKNQESISHRPTVIPSSYDSNQNQTNRKLAIPEQEEPRDKFTEVIRCCLRAEGSYLFDNLEINLSGFKNEALTEGRRLIAQESGFCSMKITESTSVVVVSSDYMSNHRSLEEFIIRNQLTCPLVKESWLTDCVKNSRLEPYDPYVIFSNDTIANQELNVDQEGVEEFGQPSIGFVVTKKDRSMTNQAKAISNASGTHRLSGASSSSVNIFESIQEATNSCGRTSRQTDTGRSSTGEEMWTTQDEEMETTYGHDSGSEDEEDEQEENDDDEEITSRENGGFRSSFSYSTQAPRKDLPKVATQAPQIVVPERDDRPLANVVSSLTSNYHKSEDRRTWLGKRREADVLAKLKRKPYSRK